MRSGGLTVSMATKATVRELGSRGYALLRVHDGRRLGWWAINIRLLQMQGEQIIDVVVPESEPS